MRLKGTLRSREGAGLEVAQGEALGRRWRKGSIADERTSVRTPVVPARRVKPETELVFFLVGALEVGGSDGSPQSAKCALVTLVDQVFVVRTPSIVPDSLQRNV